MGKKKTGLPNWDYPPLIADKKIKNNPFPILSVIYDQEHIDLRHSHINLEKKNTVKSSENIFLSESDTQLREKLIPENKKVYKDFNFESTISAGREFEVKRKDKCCDRCEIL